VNASDFGRTLGFSGANITSCCTGKFMTVRDWVFMYEENYDPSISAFEYLKNAYLNNEKSKGRYMRGVSPTGEEFNIIAVPRFAEKHGLDPSAMRKCCNGKYTNHKGWKFYFVVETPIIKKEHKKVNFQIVYKGISPLGVEHIFTNAKDFAKDNELNSYAISKCCRGTMRKHYGWTFQYISHTDFDSVAA
jgi:hypothetical protein